MNKPRPEVSEAAANIRSRYRKTLDRLEPKPTPSTLCHRTDKTRCQFVAKGNAFQCDRSAGGCGTTVDSKMPEFEVIQKQVAK